MATNTPFDAKRYLEDVNYRTEILKLLHDCAVSATNEQLTTEGELSPHFQYHLNRYTSKSQQILAQLEAVGQKLGKPSLAAPMSAVLLKKKCNCTDECTCPTTTKKPETAEPLSVKRFTPECKDDFCTCEVPRIAPSKAKTSLAVPKTNASIRADIKTLENSVNSILSKLNISPPEPDSTKYIPQDYASMLKPI